MELTTVKDGFSFRPQREKRETFAHHLSPPRNSAPPKKRSSGFKHSCGQFGNDSSKFPLLEYPDFIQVQMEAEDHFSKLYTFTKPSPKEGSSGWKLPPPDTMFTAPVWQNEEFLEMKKSLNEIKQQLGSKEVSVWTAHTSNTNPSGRVCHAVRRRAQPEMVTQAWLKFYEIVNAFPIVPLGDGEGRASPGPGQQCHLGEEGTAFNSVHLCEAPGAFISALNHYLALNRSTLKWQWLGNTLNPYYEGTPLAQCITEDRLIYHTLKNWSFGTDDTGDLMQWDNLCEVVHRAECLGPIHLITADGSFDCQANPAEQEKMTHPLHMWETVAALSILAPGGSFVIKKFTLFESETVCLMYLLCCVFEMVYMYKPGTSKQGNSEVYVVASDYLGKEYFPEHFKKILEVYKTTNQPQSMFRVEDVPEDFMYQIKECSSKFMAYQVQSIKRNLELFKAMPEKQKQLNELLKTKATALFFERNYCAPIPKWKTLTQGNVNKSRNLLESDWNKTASAMLMRSTSYPSKLEILDNFLCQFIEDYSNNNRVIVEETEYSVSCFSPQNLEELEFDVMKGKPVHYMESSKFCSEKILRVFRELHRLWMSKTNGVGEIKLDDTLAGTVLSLHPGALLVRGENTPGPHSGCLALEQALALLGEGGGLAVGASVVLVNPPLLSRLQYSLLLVLAAAFKQVLVYKSLEVGRQMPVIVLDHLKSHADAERVVKALRSVGWDPAGVVGAKRTVLQIVALHNLLQDKPLRSLFHYNIHLCAQHALALLQSVKS